MGGASKAETAESKQGRGGREQEKQRRQRADHVIRCLDESEGRHLEPVELPLQALEHCFHLIQPLPAHPRLP